MIYSTKSKELIAALAKQYIKGTIEACVIAELCDESLDRSGALLGKVREAASNLRTSLSIKQTPSTIG